MDLQELKYLLSLCGASEDVCDEILQRAEQIEYGGANGQSDRLPNAVLAIIKTNAKSNPVAVFQLLKLLRDSRHLESTETNESIKAIIRDEIDADAPSLWCEYSAFYGENVALPKRNGPEREYYATRLTIDVAEEATETPECVWPMDADAMLARCHGTAGRHWLPSVVDAMRRLLDEGWTNADPVADKLWQLLLVDAMNGNNTIAADPSAMIQRIDKLSAVVNRQNHNETFNIYRDQIMRETNLIRFCVNNNRAKKKYFSWNDACCDRSALSVISHVCGLNNLDRFKVRKVLALDAKYSEPVRESSIQWDLITFNAYCLMTLIIDYITMNDSHLDEIKSMMTNLHPLSYKFEIMKCIFACVFVRYEHFSHSDSRDAFEHTSHSDASYFARSRSDNVSHGGFVCTAETLRSILAVLKDSLADVGENRLSSEGDDFFKQWSAFETHVADAIWKCEFINGMNCERIELFDSVSTLDENMYRHHPQRRRKKSKKGRSKSCNENLCSVSLHKELKDKNTVHRPDYISLMLSPPTCLITLCLESNDFNKAHKIIHMYDLMDTDAYLEVCFAENLIILLDKINAKSKNKEFITNSPILSTAVASIVETFLSTMKPAHNYQLFDLVQTFPQLHIYDDCHFSFFILIDVLISSGINQNVSYGILNVIEKKLKAINVELSTKHNNFITFIKNQLDIFYKLYENDTLIYNKYSICDILSTDKIPVTFKNFVQLCGNTNDISTAHKNFLSTSTFDSIPLLLFKQRKIYLNSIIDVSNCHLNKNSSEKCDVYSYLKYFVTHLMNISKLSSFQEDDNNIDRKSIYEVLERPLHHILGELIDKKDVSLDKIENLCKQFRINLIHKLVLNYCSEIKCSTDSGLKLSWNDNDSEDCYDDVEETAIPFYNKPSQTIITYILIHNWVIANLLKKIHHDNTEHVLEHSIDTRTHYMDKYLRLEKFDTLKSFFNNNKPLAAMQTTYNLKDMLKATRNLCKDNKYTDALSLIDALPENIGSNEIVKKSKIDILQALCASSQDQNNLIHFILLMDKCSLDNFQLDDLKKWDHDSAIIILQYIIHHKKLNNECLKVESIQWLERISVYHKISKLSNEHNWADIHTISYEDPETVLQILLDEQQFDLCFQWSELHSISSNVKKLILHNLLKQHFQMSSDMNPHFVKRIISELPVHEAVALCKNALPKLRDIPVLRIIHNFLQHNTYDSLMYENIRIGIELLAEMDTNERSIFWELLAKPLLIIEQYLMNAKLERLERLLKKIRPMLVDDAVGDNLFYNIALINTVTVSVNSVDALLRMYASKALDLKSNRYHKYSPIEKQTNETAALLQSIDSINLVGDSEFVLPEKVPNREDWTPDNFSDSCMVCKTTFFSILIRRHHCRRCGRLVCYSCSRHKMTIYGFYSDIEVRVCDDCYSQTIDKSNAVLHKNHTLTYAGSVSANSDSPSMEWCLSLDQKYNTALRKEFIYEFSPDVHLCLTIMKMHTVNLTYPRFLQDRSSELSKAVGKANDGILELIHMQRALLVCCTVLYTQPILYTSANIIDMALEHTHYLLSVTDALAKLATHGCHSLMPEIGSINTHYIRQLLKIEKWELALEMCTKFGLSRIGVLAAWGTACLKSGCFNLARQKFALCFKSSNFSKRRNSQNEDPGEVESFIEQKMHKSEQSNQIDLNKSMNNSVLLDEIISLLEMNSYCMNMKILKKLESVKVQQHSPFSSFNKSSVKLMTSDHPLNITHALAGLNKIKEGDYSDFSTYSYYTKKTRQLPLLRKQSLQNEKLEYKRKIEPFFYDECIYYLTTYGSHSKLINFYLKYDNLNKAIQHCHKESVDKEIFAECIFMKYVKDKKIDDLLKAMYTMDNTWKIWTEYLIYACRLLEHKRWFEPLLAVQSGIGDHIRAAITCVSLYTRHTQAPHIATLHTRTHYLVQARGHLQHVPRKLRQAISAETEPSSRSLHLTMNTTTIDKHINTITKQMEIVTSLYVCEMSGRLTDNMVDYVSILSKYDAPKESKSCLPTLFGNTDEKIKLCVLLLVSGENVKDNLGIVIRLIKEYNLDSLKIFNCTSLYFINNDLYDDVLKLCDLIREFYEQDPRTLIDNMIETCVASVVRKCDAKGQLFDELAEMFISKTDNISIKIICYIECRLLKTAYYLAVQNNRYSDLRKIMNEAERLGQINVKNACMKKMATLNL